MDTDSPLFKEFVSAFHGRRNMPERGQPRLVRDPSIATSPNIIDKGAFVMIDSKLSANFPSVSEALKMIARDMLAGWVR